MIYREIRAHDQKLKVKLENHEFSCFSKKELSNIHPEDNYTVVGEVIKNNKKRAIADFIAGEKTFKVSRYGKNGRVLNKEAGFVKVGENEYIAVLKSRIPFLLILAALGIILLLLLAMLLQPEGDDMPVINPNNPLPPQDQNAVIIDPNAPLPEDKDEEELPPDVEPGGGSLSMIYTLEAEISLSNGNISLYFMNPSDSTHDVVLEAYVVANGTEYLVAKSGRLPAGYSLPSMALITDNAVLSEGIYEGLYKVQCYNPQTGELALVAPQITDLTITVKQ